MKHIKMCNFCNRPSDYKNLGLLHNIVKYYYFINF